MTRNGSGSFPRGAHVAWRPAFLTFLSLLVAGAAIADEDDGVVSRTGSFSEDVYATGKHVMVRAQIQGDLIAIGERIEADPEVSGNLLAMGGQVAVGERIGGNALVSGGTIEMRATVADGATVIGGNVVIESGISGQSLVVAGNARVGGRYADDLKVMGGNVKITAMMTSDLWAAGGMVNLRPEASVGGSAWLAGGGVRARGAVAGNLRIAARNAEVGGEVLGDLHIDAHEVTILPTARIRGRLIYRAPDKADIHPDAVIGGDVSYTRSESPRRWTHSILAVVGGAIVALMVGLMVLGGLQVAVFPAQTLAAVRRVSNHPLRATAVGFALLVSAPVLMVLLASTIIGIPLTVVIGATSLLAVVLSFLLTAMAIGRWALDRFGRDPDLTTLRRIAAVSLGIVVLMLIALVPIVGVLSLIVAVSLGLGTLAGQVWRSRAASV